MSLLISPHIQSAFHPAIKSRVEGTLTVRVTSPATPLNSDELDTISAAYLSLDVLRTAHTTSARHVYDHYSEVLLNAPKLRWLHTGIAGADNTLYRQLIARGVAVTTSSGANAQAVAHSAIAGVMALARGVPQWLDTQRRRAWEPLDGPRTPRDLPGQHITVIGLGPIGLTIGKIGKALGLHVTGITRRVRAEQGFDQVLAFADLDLALARTDWLVLACPLNDTTRGLIDRKALDRLPAGARLINVSRGGIVDENALLDALVSGRLSGAYSDVFATEPLPQDSPLWAAPNLLISSHTAGRGDGAESRATDIFLDNLGRWLKQEPLVNLVVSNNH